MADSSFTQLLIIAIISGVFALLAVFLDRERRERTTRKRVFQALYVEIQMNREIVQRDIGFLHVPISDSNTPRSISDLSTFLTLAYQSARTSGELIGLSMELLMRIWEVYDRLEYINKKVTKGEYIPLDLMLEEIKNDLASLANEISRKL